MGIYAKQRRVDTAAKTFWQWCHGEYIGRSLCFIYGNLAIVGGPNDNGIPGSIRGAALVLTRSGKYLTQQQKLVGTVGVGGISRLFRLLFPEMVVRQLWVGVMTMVL